MNILAVYLFQKYFLKTYQVLGPQIKNCGYNGEPVTHVCGGEERGIDQFTTQVSMN